MFGERDVFLSIFNPLYFIEELGEDGKKLLERYLPPIPQDEVLAQLNEQTRERLSGGQLPSPETFLKNRREEIRGLEQNAVYLSGKLDLAQKQRQSSKELSSGLTVRIQELQQEISLLEARQFENVNLEDLQEQLVQASEQYEELSGEAPEVPDTAELDAKLQEFHAKLGARSAEVYQPKYTPVPSRRRPRKKGTDFYEPFLRTMEETEQTSILRFFQFIVDLLFCLTGY